MKITMKSLVLGLAVLITGSTIAQKSNVVSAAVEYKKSPIALLMQGKTEEATKVLETAKEYIDKAAMHEDTKNDSKMNYYKGMIYMDMVIVKGAADPEFAETDEMEAMLEEAKTALQAAHTTPKSKYKRDVEDYVNRNASMAFQQGAMMFKAKQFDVAAMSFIGAKEMKDILGIEDAEALTNARISALRNIDTLKTQGKNDEALKFIDDITESLGNDLSITIEAVNIALDKGDKEAAEKYLGAAIEADPKNKQLYYTMGTIYMNQGESDKAEENFLKALEIDPEYVNANYQLGAFYLNLAQDVRDAASKMDIDDPNYESETKRSEELFMKAIAPLEKVAAAEPNNADVLDTLFKVCKRAGESEKALAYKKKAEEIRAKQ